MFKNKRGSSTVRGAKASPSRTPADQVFGYATIPRNFRGGNNFSPGSPARPLYSVYGNDGQIYMSSFAATNGGGGKQVVDGYVVNRFQKPPSPSPYQNNNLPVTPKSLVMNSQFYSKPAASPGTFKFDSPSPTSQEEDFPSPTDSFEMSMSYNNHPPALPEHPPLSSRRSPPENKPSLLLSHEENQVIFDILGKGRQTLATAVAQLVVPIPNQQGWQIKETGVVCLVRDTTKRSYYIQVYSMRSRTMVFRQEIYGQFEYDMPMQTFFTFEGDSSMVGISFADTTEAWTFKEALDNKLESKRQRRSERENRRSKIITENNHTNNQQGYHHNNTQYQPNQNHVPPPAAPAAVQQYQPPQKSISNGVPATTVSTTYNFPAPKSKANKNNKGKDKKKLTLRKEDIGKPMDFRHVQHVGWDPNKGFDLDGKVDENLLDFFERAGISSDALKDESTRKFIYNFIDQNGGLEAIRNETTRPPAPPPPVMNSAAPPPPPVPNRQEFRAQQQQPQQQPQKPAAPPPPPSRPVPPVPGYNQGVPPPPPPMRTSSSNVVEKSPNNQSYQSQNNGPARPPLPHMMMSPSPSKPVQQQSNGTIPPPPPPPPPMPQMGVGAPPPPPLPQMSAGDQADSCVTRSTTTPQKSLPPVSDDRGNLLAQIQKGVQLKKVDPADTPPKPAAAGGLAACLGQIRGGVGLKPVQHTPKEAPSLDTMDGLAGALARALADRSRAINPDTSSDEDEDEEADDDEWAD